MKFLVLLVATVVCAASSAGQTNLPSYHSDTEYQFAAAGAYRFGLNGYDNPALLGQLHQADLMVGLTSRNANLSDLRRWGLFTGAPGFGFGLRHMQTDAGSVTDYRISTGFGNRGASAGFSVGWAGGDTGLFPRSTFARFGMLVRPGRYVSVGLVGSKAFGDRSAEGVVDLALRPLGTEVLTVFADYAVQQWQQWNRGAWSLGGVVEPLDGIRIGARLYDTRAWSIGFSFSVGRAGVSVQNAYSRDGDRLATNFVLRSGAYDRTIIDSRFRNRTTYVPIAPEGRVGYQRFKWFDSRPTLSGLLKTLDAARTDPRVSVVAVNTSQLSANRHMLWELREALAGVKKSGKKVLVYVDRAEIDLYHFATVADRIVMDPLGTLLLTGYVSGRLYLKGTLEKIGVGYDEWRFFKYKSANETFSRDSMSAAEREQRARMIELYYQAAREEISTSRGLTPAAFDTLINREAIFLAEDAVNRRLVDTLARWDAVKDLAGGLAGSSLGALGAGSLLAFNLPTDDRWGEPPAIAVVYALGVCAMDEGIKARSLSRLLQGVVDNPRISAIVLRVDSPGGDGMASDYVSEVMRKAKGKKPIIVSQGSVAASGGYWLSMYGDSIVTGPSTITGSIGVAGGWMYNKGLKEWLGASTDHVKAGDHADLGYGLPLPFLGRLPDRNLLPEERGRVEQAMRRLYTDFIGKVGKGRGMSPETVDSLGQGRIWIGKDALVRGLVDEIGGLNTAIAIARDRAGIRPDQEVRVLELPEPGLFNLQFLLGGMLPVTEENAFVKAVEFLARHNGQPLPILPLDEIDVENFR